MSGKTAFVALASSDVRKDPNAAVSARYRSGPLKRGDGGVACSDAAKFAPSDSETKHVQLTIARHIDLALDDCGFNERSPIVVPWSGRDGPETRSLSEFVSIENPQFQSIASDNRPDTRRPSIMLVR